MHAGRGQHIAAAISPGHALGAQAYHGEVRGAAANVHHQHQRLAVDALLVVQRGGDGLELKTHVLEPCRQRGLAQRVLSLLIARGVAIHKMHRPPHHHPPGHAPQRVTGLLRQHPQEEADDVLVADHLVVYRRLVLQQRTAQQALERAHQPPFGTRQVLRHRIAPKVRALVFRVEEQRRGQRRRIPLQRHHPRRPSTLAHRHRGIGSAKVDTKRDVLQKGHGRRGRETTRNAARGGWRQARRTRTAGLQGATQALRA